MAGQASDSDILLRDRSTLIICNTKKKKKIPISEYCTEVLKQCLGCLRGVVETGLAPVLLDMGTPLAWRVDALGHTPETD